jgi:hypothetical protein
MIEELNQTAEFGRLATNNPSTGLEEEMASLNASRSFSGRGRGGWRGGTAGPRGGNRGQSYQRSGTTPSYQCEVCKMAGRPERIYRSHNKEKCKLIATFRAIDLEDEGDCGDWEEEDGNQQD